jgi:TPR repeat protein
MAHRRRTWRIAVLLASLGLGACHDRSTSPGERGAAKPVDVTSVIAGCRDLGECNRLCAAQQAPACVSAGRLYEFGHGVPADPARAFPLYVEACDLKFAGGCYNAAVLLEAGKGVDKDPVRARALYGKVCAMGSQTSCERARALGVPGKHETS